MEQLMSLTNGEIIIIGLAAFAAVLIFPRLLRRKRIQKQVWNKRQSGESLKPEDFSGRQKLFHTHNGSSREIEEFLVKLKTYAFKHEMKIVFPGSFHYKDTVSPTTLILVGRFGLLLIRCYGFGGHIYRDGSHGRFMQNMNEVIREIPSPSRSMDQEEDLARLLLRQTPWKNVPISSASVFTRSGVILDLPAETRIFDRSHFLYWLETDNRFREDADVPVKPLCDYLVQSVRQTETA